MIVDVVRTRQAAGHGGRHKLGGAGARAAGWPAGEGAGDTTGVMHAGPDGYRSAP